MAVSVAAAGLPGGVSSPVLEAFVAKVSEVEAEFHRRISEVQAEFRDRISDLQAAFCERMSAPAGGSGPDVILPSKKTIEEQWSVVCRGTKRRKVLKVPHHVETRNAFSVLESATEEEVKVARGGKEGEDKADEGTLPAGKVFVYGDSQVRHLDSAFCARDRKNRSRVCLPGAGIGRVSDRLDTSLKNDGTNPIVFLSAGGNDLGKVRSEELFRKFRQALDRIKDKGGIPVVCGVLPRRGVGAEWLSRAIAVNRRLANHCRSNGWSFIDNWDCFYGKDTLYARDGVHLSRQGVRVLAGTLEREVGALQRFFR